MYKDLITDVFFDLDHTLWDFERNSALTFDKIFQENAIQVELSDFLRVYVPANYTFWKLFREGKITKEALRYQRLKSVFNELKYEVSDETINHLADQYIHNLPGFNHLFPDTIPVLDYLKRRYKLHIITNGFEEIQAKKLTNSKIAQYFDQVINSEMAGVKKPHPLIFELAIQNAGTTPERSIMIGDSLEADIHGAKAVGLHVLHFNSDKGPIHDVCHIIHDLIEIKTYL